MTSGSYHAAVARGVRLRWLAFDTVQREHAARLTVPFRFTEITRAALVTWQRDWRPWYTEDAPGAHWDWAHLVHATRRDPRRFEAALWSGNILCGLALGGLTRGRHAVLVRYIAGAPDADHPLKRNVLPLMIEVAEAYARAWSATEVRLVDPLPGVVHLYEDFGYPLVAPPGQIPYCGRRLTP